MLYDEYGNFLGTSSSKARDAYNLGVSRFLGAEPEFRIHFKTLLMRIMVLHLPEIGLAQLAITCAAR